MKEEKIIYKKRFEAVEKKTAPTNIVASSYKKGSKWRNIDWANINDKPIVSKLSPTLLKMGSEFDSEEISGSGHYTIRVSWKNSNGIEIGSFLNFDNENEAREEGWI